jgi:cell division protein FtsN
MKSRRWQYAKMRGGMILGLFIGLVVGVGIAFGIVWYLNRTPLPFQDKAPRAERKDQTNGQARSGQAPQPLPGKPGDTVTEKPRFEFYKILPGDQQATPQGAPPPVSAPAPAQAQQPDKAAVPPPAAIAVPPATAAEQFYLQAGAFNKPQDADNLKARLALLGLEVGVQEVNVPDKGTMHRVRVGPFASAEEMNRVRNQMSQSGIQATPIKVRPQ